MIEISQEVKEALKNNLPVVALESTIISHGMPYPENFLTALQVEKIIRENGAIPATIGIIEGVPVVGLNEKQLKEFSLKKDIMKVSRRDIPVVINKKMWGATTVASTMIFAALAGIEVFVTGGIGGVHREAPATFDISADLQELANTNVTVVCAGIKSILDLPLTLEYLETYGVPVLGYKSKNLAAFYTTDSGYPLDYSMSSPEEIANIIKIKRSLNLKGGLLISNPILKEDSLDKEYIDKLIDEALLNAKQEGIKGKEVTPYLLKWIKEKSEGYSLEANIKLIYNNAKLGALIAKELMKQFN